MPTHTLRRPEHLAAAYALERLDPHCLPDRVVTQLLTDAPWRRLAVIGDSIAEGVGDPVPGYRDLSWAQRLTTGLEAAVGAIAHLNTGARGQTAAEIRDTQVGRARAFSPDLVVVSAGANDMLRRSFDPPAVESELEAILGELSAQGALIVTFGLLDLSSVLPASAPERRPLHDRIATLNALTADVTRRHHGIHVDFFAHPALSASLFSADLIHPNRRGHAYIAGDVVRALSAQIAAESRSSTDRICIH